MKNEIKIEKYTNYNLLPHHVKQILNKQPTKVSFWEMGRNIEMTTLKQIKICQREV